VFLYIVFLYPYDNSIVSGVTYVDWPAVCIWQYIVALLFVSLIWPLSSGLQVLIIDFPGTLISSSLM